ncbi:Bug family tripartite tricarboxylate transporter substrate binding protein [Cupriavidus sp. 2TAF22]|uniref:Bug family tripartite tricarboxylate transporter substrate binding protein n=1 Tax=unclassified Cupriavidus TaxID=2640874 RepID=UPI003F91DF36
MKMLKATLGLLLSCAAAFAAHAADYPAKPVRVLVGFPPGQTTDVIARKLAQRLSTALGQSFYVENKPGAGAGLAAEAVARADPDGYTILATSSGPLAVNGWIYKNLKYDATRDFEPIASIGLFPLVLVANPKSRFSSVRDLVAYARQNPGKVNYASGGNGVTNHLVMEMFKDRAGVNLTHVPYKGGVAGMTDVMGGQVDVMFEVVSIAEPLIRQGKLKAIAVASEQRVSTLPGVPTIGESGYPGFRGDPWIGVVAPRNVPQPVLARLSAEIGKIVRSADWQKEVAGLGAQTVVMEPREFGVFIQSEIARWGGAAKRANVTVD